MQDVDLMAGFLSAAPGYSIDKGDDVGQTGDGGFVVLADPEGNEFCVLLRGPA